MTLIVTAPISGIRLDNEIRSFNLAVFNFGYLEDLKFPISNEPGMYISTTIENVYDKVIAIQRANNAFINFTRLIIFISGKVDRSIFIETGLPLRPNYTHETMYISTSSFQISDDGGILDLANISNNHVEKIPVNNKFFSENEIFGFIWILYEKKHKGLTMSDLESRTLNSALALGESASTKDTRNSIIYTCISLEVLFSLDSGSLFQKSIGEKLADIFAFIIAKDKESRLQVGALIKKVYTMRSAIVHGGDKELSNENLDVNILMRAAISELFHSERFKNFKSISQVYDSLKHAQNSY